MSDKVIIKVRPEDLTIVGDEFRYKYTYEDIVYMLNENKTEKEEKTAIRDRLQTKLNDITLALDILDTNILNLEAIRAQIEPEEEEPISPEEEEEPISPEEEEEPIAPEKDPSV
jgi:hypothetical protein